MLMGFKKKQIKKLKDSIVFVISDISHSFFVWNKKAILIHLQIISPIEYDVVDMFDKTVLVKGLKVLLNDFFGD